MSSGRVSFASVVILCCAFAASAQDFASIDAFRKSVLKGEDSVSVEAKGDLNADKLEDWAGVIHRQPADAAATYQLYVLLRQPAGGYQVVVTTKEEQIAGMGCCWVEDLRIARSSIYIQNNAKTAATMEAGTHQFKFHKNEWRLVGVKIYYIDHVKNTTTETDMNVLTGAVIETTQKGNRKGTSKRKSKKFGVYLLKDYDFSNMFGTVE